MRDPSADLQVAGGEGHWTKCGVAEAPGPDAYRPVQLKGRSAPDGETAERSAEARHVGKADRQVDRHHRLLAGGQRQPERKIAGRCMVSFGYAADGGVRLQATYAVSLNSTFGFFSKVYRITQSDSKTSTSRPSRSTACLTPDVGSTSSTPGGLTGQRAATCGSRSSVHAMPYSDDMRASTTSSCSAPMTPTIGWRTPEIGMKSWMSPSSASCSMASSKRLCRTSTGRSIANCSEGNCGIGGNWMRLPA